MQNSVSQAYCRGVEMPAPAVSAPGVPAPKASASAYTPAENRLAR